MLLKSFLILWAFLWINSHAATVAILDTGIDFNHFELGPHQFINGNEQENGRDSDGNGYIDDVSGWNFMTMGPRGFISESYPPFSEDQYRYYLIRRQRSLNLASAEEEKWYQEKRKDQAFQEVRRLFRRSLHGTHVAGIATGLGLKQILKTNHLPPPLKPPELLNVTYLGEAKSGPALEPQFTPLQGDHQEKMDHLKKHLKRYLKWQKNKLATAIGFAATQAHIINASFGISYSSAGKMVKEWWDLQFPQKKLGTRELTTLQNSFRQGLLTLTKEVVENYPQLLFVFSAGNGNDPTMTETHYPSGVRCSRCLTVGATLGTLKRARFSNYGKKSVTLFAPGVAMESTVPGDRFLPVNGTSQAAPQVAFALANVLKVAWSQGLFLRLSSAKDILKESVDRHENLRELCQSGGILNPMRAVKLTQLLKNHSWARAVRLAYQTVPDQSFDPGLHKDQGLWPASESDPLLTP